MEGQEVIVLEVQEDGKSPLLDIKEKLFGLCDQHKLFILMPLLFYRKIYGIKQTLTLIGPNSLKKYILEYFKISQTEHKQALIWKDISVDRNIILDNNIFLDERASELLVLIVFPVITFILKLFLINFLIK